MNEVWAFAFILPLFRILDLIAMNSEVSFCYYPCYFNEIVKRDIFPPMWAIDPICSAQPRPFFYNYKPAKKTVLVII